MTLKQCLAHQPEIAFVDIFTVNFLILISATKQTVPSLSSHGVSDNCEVLVVGSAALCLHYWDVL